MNLRHFEFISRLNKYLMTPTKLNRHTNPDRRLGSEAQSGVHGDSVKAREIQSPVGHNIQQEAKPEMNCQCLFHSIFSLIQNFDITKTVNIHPHQLLYLNSILEFFPLNFGH